MTLDLDIQGHIAAGFEPVRDVFAANFSERGDVGASFCFIQNDAVLVDIHAGIADRKAKTPWTDRTICSVFSTTKAITGIVMSWLVDQGRISYSTPLSDVWPEFAAAGKAAITLEQALSHQAGVSGIPFEMDAADWFDRELMESRVAAMAPLWPLSEGGSGYHPISFGVLADAVARRVDVQARSVGGILREEIAGPRGIDFHIGVAEADFDRCAMFILPPRLADLGEMNAVTQAAFTKPWSSPGRRGIDGYRKAELPAANGHGNAKSIATLMSVYASGGMLQGESLISEGTISEAMSEKVSGPDRVLPFDIAIGAGPMINGDLGVYGPEPKAVGHYGFGGSCGMADPVRNISASYVMNRQMDVLMGDERAIRLINAAYDCL